MPTKEDFKRYTSQQTDTTSIPESEILLLIQKVKDEPIVHQDQKLYFFSDTCPKIIEELISSPSEIRSKAIVDLLAYRIKEATSLIVRVSSMASAKKGAILIEIPFKNNLDAANKE